MDASWVNRASLVLAFALTGCANERTPASIDNLNGTYGAPGCNAIRIRNGVLSSNKLSVPVSLVEIKGTNYLLPDRGIVVDETNCALQTYKWQQLVKVGADYNSVSVLGRNQSEEFVFVKQ